MQWFEEHERLVFWASALSLLTLLATAFIGPFILVKMPADYFCRHRDAARASQRRPVFGIAFLAVRNIVGGLLILLGLLLLVLPGQGLLTIIAGLTLLTFPAKRRFMRRIVFRPRVRRSIDWLRLRAGREPLVVDAESEEVPPSSVRSPQA